MKDSFSKTAFDSRKYSPLVYEEPLELSPGSIAYDDYWDEQDDRCLNGFKPEGMPRIAGEHYFYLNMCKISLLQPGGRRKAPGCPFYRALDRRLSLEVEEAKEYGHGLIIGKPRRVGLSWFGAMQIAYEMLFYRRNQLGVCAGKADKADDFYKKVLWLLASINKAYRSSVITKNNEELKLGYSYRDNKQDIEAGLLSQLYIKTMYADSAAFEGKEMALVVFEEAGLFENLVASYKSTEPCFKDGGIQYGIPMIYGTGGEIEKGSKGYKEMWDLHKKYNLKKIFIPADEQYPGEGEESEDSKKIVSFFDMRTGETNRVAAKKHILAERKKIEGVKDGYIKHIQSYPLKESEIFLKSKGGILDIKLLNGQLVQISDQRTAMIPKQGRFTWIDTDECKRKLARCVDTKQKSLIRIKYKSKVKFIEDPNGTVFKCAEPINRDGMQFKPDIGGVDSYDDEVNFDENGGSFGASMIYRCHSGVTKEHDFPVAYVKERGDASSDDVFYQNTLMLAVYYNAEMLIEYSKTAIVTYFKDCRAEKYLKLRPNLESTLGPSTSRNEYGQRVNLKEKRLITRLLKSDVKENVYKYVFADHVVELIDYGDINTDLAMAHGLCLIHKLDLFPEISEDLDNEYEVADDDFLSMTYYDVEDGVLKVKTYSDLDDEMYIEKFDPKIHASREEHALYQQEIEKEKSERQRVQKEIEAAYGKDIMGLVLHEYRSKEK